MGEVEEEAEVGVFSLVCLNPAWFVFSDSLTFALVWPHRQF